MPTALYASPFPSLDLSVDDRESLMRTADDLINQVQDKYERFMWQEREQLSSERWKHICSREDMSVYNDRRPGADTGNRNMHLLLVTGSIIANLNDAMYGVLNHTTDAMRIKTAYVQDTLLDSAVLETILEPTPDQPFQSLTVRWFVKGVPLHVRAMSKHRDNVFLEATGMKQLSNGETVGFHLMHSLKFDKTPALPQYDRFNFSICTLWRQTTPQRVQAYMTCYVEIAESFATPFVVKSTGEAIVSLWKMTQCAQMKKLAWIVQQKSMFTELNEKGRASAMEEGCSVCGSQSRSARQGVKSACAACSKYTCKKCRVKHDLSIFAPDGQLLKHTMRFCVPCLTVVQRLDAAAVAAHEATSREQQHKSGLKAALGRALGVSPGSSFYSSVASESGDSVSYDKHTWSMSTTSTASLSAGKKSTDTTTGIII